MFHNFTCRGITSRVWMATVGRGIFGACRRGTCPDIDLLPAIYSMITTSRADSPYTSDTSAIEQVFRKGVSLFQKVIAYAHTRGVQIGLGLDINLIPADYQAKADDPDIIAARVDQIVTDYPRLDYLILLCLGRKRRRRDVASDLPRLLRRHQKTLAADPLGGGWLGARCEPVAKLPADVICAAISAYSDRCESGRHLWQSRVLGLPLA